MARLKTIQTETLSEELEPTSAPRIAQTVPLFPDLGTNLDDASDVIVVSRLDPPHGYLGTAPAHTDEEGLRRLFGGKVLEVSIRNKRGQLMPNGRKVITIDAPPVSREVSNETARQMSITPSRTPDEAVAIYNMQQRMWNEQVMMLREQHKADIENRRNEMEMILKRLETEAQIREEREARRHERLMQEERARSEEARRERDAQIERERQLNQAMIEQEKQRAERDRAQNQQFLATITKISTDASNFMVSVLNANRNTADPVSLLERGMNLAANITQQDPATAQMQAVASSVQNLVTLATAPQLPAQTQPQPVQRAKNPGRPKRGAPAEAPTAAPSAPVQLPPLTPEQSQADLMAVMQDLQSQGLNPQEVIARLARKELTIVDAEWASEAQEAIDDLNEIEDEEETRNVDAEPQAQDTAKNAVANGRRADVPGTGKPAMEQSAGSGVRPASS